MLNLRLIIIPALIPTFYALKAPFNSDGSPCSAVFEANHFSGYLVRDCLTRGSHVYWRMEHRMSWPAARKACRKVNGGDLVSIHDFEEKRLANDLAQNNWINPHDQEDHWNGIDQGVWIGLYERTAHTNQTKVVWVWSDGSRLKYEDWLGGQPDHHAGKEHCVQLTNFLRGTNGGSVAFGWNDLGCMWGLKSICKAPIASIHSDIQRKH